MKNWNIIPGVRQDHEGRLYQIAFAPDGSQHRLEYIEENPKQYPEMERIEVPSQSDLPLPEGRSSQWVLDAIEKGYLFKRGDTFYTLRLFQGGR